MLARFRAAVDGLRRWYRHLAVLYRRLVQLAVVLLCAALVAVVGWISWPHDPDPYCVDQGATVLKHASGECVGISDGSIYHFTPELADIENKIHVENQTITAQHPDEYVSVVFLLPISTASGSITSITNITEQLRGAYTAQHYVNGHDVEGVRPYIQLLIGNDGYQANQWPTAVSVIKEARGRARIAAVAGLGVSLATTIDAARHLTTDAGLPVIGATVTADDFDNIRGFIRVAPSNNDDIAVAVQYIRKKSTRGFLIQDENGEDAYDATLVTQFQQYSDPDHTIVGKETYDSTPRTQAASDPARAQADGTIRNRISQMTADICAAQPAAVLFAGRGRDLAELLADLRNRPCLGTPITVISGDDVTNMPFSAEVGQGLASGVTVDYAGIANPDEWSQGQGTGIELGRQGFNNFNTVFQQQFPGASLTDGNTMMAHDAVLTATSAIRLTSLPQPTPDQVTGELGALHGAHKVLGASGPLAFTADYSTSLSGSNPSGRAIPILQLGPTGDSTFQAPLEWPQGEPTPY